MRAGSAGWVPRNTARVRFSTPNSKSPTPTGRWTSSPPMIRGRPGRAKSSARTSNGAKSWTHAKPLPIGISRHSTTVVGEGRRRGTFSCAGPAARPAGARADGTGSAKNHPARRRLDRGFRPEPRRPCPSLGARPGRRARSPSATPRRLNPDGSLYTENLRTALATDRFTLDGAGRETFEPHFTFHGFRYVEITGYPGEADGGRPSRR